MLQVLLSSIVLLTAVSTVRAEEKCDGNYYGISYFSKTCDDYCCQNSEYLWTTYLYCCSTCSKSYYTSSTACRYKSWLGIELTDTQFAGIVMGGIFLLCVALFIICTVIKRVKANKVSVRPSTRRSSVSSKSSDRSNRSRRSRTPSPAPPPPAQTASTTQDQQIGYPYPPPGQPMGYPPMPMGYPPPGQPMPYYPPPPQYPPPAYNSINDPAYPPPPPAMG